MADKKTAPKKPELKVSKAMANSVDRFEEAVHNYAIACDHCGSDTTKKDECEELLNKERKRLLDAIARLEQKAKLAPKEE